MTPKLTLDQPITYRVCVQGALDARWVEYFEDLEREIEASPDGSSITILTGTVLDQAAIYGVLQKLYNLGFPLISVQKIEPKG